MPEPVLLIATLTEPLVRAVTTSALEPSCARLGRSSAMRPHTGSMPCGGVCAGATPLAWGEAKAGLGEMGSTPRVWGSLGLYRAFQGFRGGGSTKTGGTRERA